MIARVSDARWTARRWGIRACASAAASTGLDGRGLSRLGAGDVVVLNLHSVSPDRTSLASPISPETLDGLVRWLLRRCRIATLQAIEAAPARDERPIAVLSFDDGYRDFLEYAMPVLDRHAVHAVVNVVPACVDSGLPPWNVLLAERLQGLPDERLRAIRLPGLPAGPPGRGAEARIRHAVALSRLLKMRPREERHGLVSELCAQLDDAHGGPGMPMLSRADLAEVARDHEIGLHSYDHDSMGFESDAFFRRDLHRCLDWAAAHLPVPPKVYAFPNGSARDAQVRIAREAGLRDVLLGGERPSRVGARAHPRITLFGSSDAELRLRLARALSAAGGDAVARTRYAQRRAAAARVPL
jgi:peptidoglycan/xylan/chitin deacetylase (PgdA/CDA1 family)